MRFAYHKRVLIAGLLLLGLFPLFSQEEGADPAALIGISLEELITRFGVPDSVHAVRGLEEWQDDVVFVYGSRDFYIFKDRVWQLGLKSFSGVGVGARRDMIALMLGEGVEIRGDHALLPLTGRPLPLVLRFNTDRRDMVSAIFIYRSDF